MSKSFVLPQVEGKGFLESLTKMAQGLLEKGIVDALLVPQHLPKGAMVQHTLVKDPEALRGVDPIAPVLPVNGGILAALLTRQDPGGPVGALLRPCEIRAFVELVKLHQGEHDRILLLGIDCMGTFEPPAYREWDKAHAAGSQAFIEAMLSGGTPLAGAPSLRRCCQACEYPTPDEADIQLWMVGTPKPLAMAGTAKGEEALRALQLSETETPAQRKNGVEALIGRRTESRDRLFEQVEGEVLPLEHLLGELAPCINCYNCRDVCPVCYCKSCVMDSSTLEHPSSQYMRWAKKKGVIKMPTETLFYHMTRMSHMSTSCVGCGQCSSACPMGIRVGEIFRTVARKTQAAFDYVPGRSFDEPLPLATFKEEELQPR